jgi:hypothetical protein
MMDGELEQLALNELDLTEVAKSVLREELALRGLSRQTLPPPSFRSATSANGIGTSVMSARDSTGGNDLCVVRRFAKYPDALIAKSLLDSAGIACTLADENMIGGNPFLSIVLGGIRLLVARFDMDEATKLLNEPIPDEIEVPGVGKYVQPRCPQCFSPDITFGELNDAAKASLPLGIPLPIRPNEWLCHRCGCRWTDSEEDD